MRSIVEELNQVDPMRIDTFLEQSPMFAVSRAARRFEALAADALASENVGFLEGLTLAAIFFEAPKLVKPSQLAATFATTRSNVSHCVSSLEAKGLVRRTTDPEDARVFLLTLRPQGRRTAMRVIGAFDKLQRRFEQEIGKTALKEMLGSLRGLETLHAVDAG
ncbi:MAG TPA: MarR family transcriptional regulator [Terracidiphilus sp.]|nr:MarR family transcriptional regulator [Terracidiphilus sp.]